MIVYEQNNQWVMITQHDHAAVSGQVAKVWRKDVFEGMHVRDDVLYAIAQHDRGWIGLDQTPFWNDGEKKPYSFQDFPAVPKLAFYRKGVDEVEAHSPYAGLLCSLHYVSFFPHPDSPDVMAYLADEKARQNRIKGELEFNQRELVFHFDLLQFCDNLSLYMCMQEPGVTKEKEITWFRNGFPQQFRFTQGKKVMARWVDNEHVSLHPFPLQAETCVSVPARAVSMEAAHRAGIAAAYHDAPRDHIRVTFVQG
ncbi:DUF3891 family protein [Aneurinibacillus sp. Ricciae_BoGa-3]|uniref:DUF3891 family protein n=1 Tax=Aneurinibacillus sp. Ricciae_BoGa-3 TaxID=3022697 RepID=UPI00233FC9AF|nr:DUF3891 family protein [Aneurinibacillus sp. Ricciae_BoGa-3]WCK54012.1 DUF3891 family protein [Aneurinibacillus sp. Ricciae_BoGa-3]